MTSLVFSVRARLASCSGIKRNISGIYDIYRYNVRIAAVKEFHCSICPSFSDPSLARIQTAPVQETHQEILGFPVSDDVLCAGYRLPFKG
jgi:hypothetical protein